MDGTLDNSIPVCKHHPKCPFPVPKRAVEVHFTQINTNTDPTPSRGGSWITRIQWLAFVGLWTLIGLAFAGQLYLTQAKVGTPVSWAFALSRSLADWYIFALLSAPTIVLAQQFPLGSVPVRLLLLLHLLASVVFSLVWILLRAGLTVWMDDKPFGETLRYALVATLVFNVMVYWAVVIATQAAHLYRQSQERQRRELDLERRLAEARLQALQMQLNPHFLFNALHGISALMYRDVEAADTMLVRLSELLREALHRTDEPWVPLREELSFLDRYLAIELIRFSGRLTVHRELDENTLGLAVPNLILQPLVENAIKHGVEPQTRPGVIILRAQLTPSGKLHLEVEDNGKGYDPHKPVHSGIGLANCRNRLQHLYGGEALLELQPGRGGGVRVILELPMKPSREPESGIIPEIR